ncbi:MAG: hypothetical protein KF847_20680 [Pirellulales bacterium]|nr:hypothetical protein [Pirellulales bacterium]
MQQITIQALDCESAQDAIQQADASGFGEPVRIAGRFLVVPQSELDRLEALGVSFAYVRYHHDGQGRERLLTIPVN